MSDNFFTSCYDTNGDGTVDGFEQLQAVTYAAYMAEQMNGESSGDKSDEVFCSPGDYVSPEGARMEPLMEEEPKPADGSTGGCLLTLFGFLLMFVGGIGGGVALLFHGFVGLAGLAIVAGILVGYKIMHMGGKD